jgi:hypothetical protein
VWWLHYKAKLEARKAELPNLLEQHRSLLVARTFLPPPQRAAADERIAAIARETADLFAEPASATVRKLELILRRGRFR